VTSITTITGLASGEMSYINPHFFTTWSHGTESDYFAENKAGGNGDSVRAQGYSTQLRIVSLIPVPTRHGLIRKEESP